MNRIHSWSTSQLDLKYIQRRSNTRGEAIVSASGRGELNRRNVIVESFHYPYGKYWRWSEVVSQGSKNNRDLPDPVMEPGFFALQADSLLSELPGKSKAKTKGKKQWNTKSTWMRKWMKSISRDHKKTFFLLLLKASGHFFLRCLFIFPFFLKPFHSFH